MRQSPKPPGPKPPPRKACAGSVDATTPANESATSPAMANRRHLPISEDLSLSIALVRITHPPTQSWGGVLVPPGSRRHADRHGASPNINARIGQEPDGSAFEPRRVAISPKPAAGTSKPAETKRHGGSKSISLQRGPITAAVLNVWSL